MLSPEVCTCCRFFFFWVTDVVYFSLFGRACPVLPNGYLLFAGFISQGWGQLLASFIELDDVHSRKIGCAPLWCLWRNKLREHLVTSVNILAVLFQRQVPDEFCIIIISNTQCCSFLVRWVCSEREGVYTIQSFCTLLQFQLAIICQISGIGKRARILDLN